MTVPLQTTRPDAHLAVPRLDAAWLGARALARLRAVLAPANRSLFVELVRIGFKVADHNTIAGALWSLVAPFVMLVALYLVFRNRFGEELRAYPLYLLLGIAFVNYFVTATRYVIVVLHTNRALLLNTTVPRETVILAQVAFHGYKLLVELVLCTLLAAYYGTFTWTGLAGAIPLVLGFVALVTGVGMLGAVVHSFARDIDHIWTLVSRLLLFVTPVFYGLDSLSPLARFLVYWLNPLTPFLVALRGLLIGPPAHPAVYAHAMGIGVGVLLLGYVAYLFVEGAALERT
ncbi:MAG TPA: ABC transporter permease [Candidatus Binatia bacterium]